MSRYKSGSQGGKCFRCGHVGHKSPDCYTTKHKKGYTIRGKPPAPKPYNKKRY